MPERVFASKSALTRRTRSSNHRQPRHACHACHEYSQWSTRSGVLAVVVPMTKARLLRSGVKRKFHAPFCSGGRGREAPPYRNLGCHATYRIIYSTTNSGRSRSAQPPPIRSIAGAPSAEITHLACRHRSLVAFTLEYDVETQQARQAHYPFPINTAIARPTSDFHLGEARLSKKPLHQAFEGR